jgi:hypothetical protein
VGSLANVACTPLSAPAWAPGGRRLVVEGDEVALPYGLRLLVPSDTVEELADGYWFGLCVYEDGLEPWLPAEFALNG